MGTEDLGGGWKANFKLEAGYNLDNGAGASSNANNQATGGLTTQSGAATAPQLNGATTPSTDRASLGGAQGLTFNRWSYVGLSNANMGEIRVGREYTPAFQAVLAADVVGSNGAGNSLNMTLMISGQSANAVATAASASNGISYESPSLSGFKAKYDLTTAYARYDFGVALATIGQATEKQAGSAATASEMKNSSMILGVSVPLGAYKLNANYITSNKRTDLYATYAVTDNSVGNAYGLGNGAGRMVAVNGADA
eukprot:gene10932-10737_t